MPVYKKKDKWFAKVNYTDIDGKYKSKQSRYFDTKKEAKDEEVKLIQSIGKLKADDITFRFAYEDYMEFKRKKGTHQRSLDVNRNYFIASGDFADKKVSEIRQHDIDLLKSRLEQKYAPSTTRLTLAFVKSTINYASKKFNIRHEHIDVGSIKKTPKKKLNFYTIEEYERLYSALDDDVFRALFDLLFFNGLRISEARGLTFKDFDGEHITIDKQFIAGGFSQSLKTNNSYRTLPLNSRLVDELKGLREYYSTFPFFDDTWHFFGGLRPFSECKIRLAFEMAQLKANLKRLTLHDLRHSCASYYIHLGYSMNLVAELLGDNVNTVYNTYYHLYRNDLTNMIKNAAIRG